MRANVNIARALRVVDNLDQKGKRIPLLIMSHAGFGKTSTIRKYCEYLDYNLVTVIPSQSAPDDILGIQSVKDGVLTRLTPSWFNRMKKIMENGKRTILFLDEITATDPYTMGPLLDLIFSRSLGEEILPDNVFIVAAGNYSSDLNNVFKMSAPLVNRFLILNLNNEDFDIDEIVEGTFDHIEGNNIGEYLELQNDSKLLYDYDSFAEWVQSSREVGFGVTEYTEDPKFGLINFTSVRSISYTLKFTQEYMSTYSDNLWMRVAGDTLGTSYKREGKLLREIIELSEGYFVKNGVKKTTVSFKSVAEACQMILEKGPETDLVSALTDLIKNTSRTDLSQKDLQMFKKLSEAYRTQPFIKYLNDMIVRKYA